MKIKSVDMWIREELSKALSFDVPDDLIQYLLSFNNEQDFEEYITALLDFENPQHKSFILELAKIKFPRGNLVSKEKKKITKGKSTQQEFVTVESPEPTKKKTKFVNLYSKEGDNAQVVMLKGRHSCDCQASKHKLINNCMECGRIVCTQEGSGPCFFCGNLVCTEEEEKQIKSNTKSGEKLKGTLLEQERPKGWDEAVAYRNRLIDYDRNSEKRSQVTDDDCDYFNTSSVWLNPDERSQLEQYQQEIHEKKHASRLTKKMTFDFAGRQIVEDMTTDHAVDMEKIWKITQSGSGAAAAPTKPEFRNDMLLRGSGGRKVTPGIDSQLMQVDEPMEGFDYAAATRLPYRRVQDAQLMEMSDEGLCLSMHQPWASLLVEGIKLHEGRTWYTSHRGRLWIASTAKPPDPDIVRAIENQYQLIYPDKNLKFPSFYPTSCLLGCVNVDDCLAQEDYQRKFPDGESDSPYVFICSNPTSLRIRFPIKGQHKIYSLDKHIHMAAMKSLLMMAKIN